jgi:hypothetical protein
VKCLKRSVTFEVVCFETSCGYMFEDDLALSKEKMGGGGGICFGRLVAKCQSKFYNHLYEYCQWSSAAVIVELHIIRLFCPKWTVMYCRQCL